MIENIEKKATSLETNIDMYSDYDIIEKEQGMLSMYEKLTKNEMVEDPSFATYVPGEIDTDALERIIGEMKLKETILVTNSKPRTCRLVRNPNFSGFGFSFVSEVEMDDPKKRLGMFVKDIMQGSPAEEAGLKHLDYILEIDGVSIRNESKADVVERFKKADKKVTMLVVNYERTHITSSLFDESKKWHIWQKEGHNFGSKLRKNTHNQ